MNCATDCDASNNGTITITGNLGYVYLTAGARIDNGSVLHSGVYDFYAKDATVYVWNEELYENGAYEETTFSALTNDQLADAGIWVTVTEADGPAATIYVGQKLSSDTSLSEATWTYDTETTARGNLAFSSEGEFSMTLGTEETANSAKVSLAASNKNASFDYSSAWLKNDDATTGTYTAVYEKDESSFTSGTTKPITLTAEDGSTTKTYVVTFTNGYERCNNVTLVRNDATLRGCEVVVTTAATSSPSNLTGKITVTLQDGNVNTTLQDVKNALKMKDHTTACEDHASIKFYNTNPNNAPLTDEQLAATGLSGGDVDYMIKVTSEKGTVATYTITVVDGRTIPTYAINVGDDTLNATDEVSLYANEVLIRDSGNGLRSEEGKSITLKIENTSATAYYYKVTVTGPDGQLWTGASTTTISTGMSFASAGWTMPDGTVTVTIEKYV